MSFRGGPRGRGNPGETSYLGVDLERPEESFSDAVRIHTIQRLLQTLTFMRKTPQSR